MRRIRFPKPIEGFPHLVHATGVDVIERGHMRHQKIFARRGYEESVSPVSLVFPSVRIHNGGSGNTLFVASSRTNLAMVHPLDIARVHPSCAGEVEAAFHGLREANPNHGRVLTDDFNPVEFYDAANRENIRRNLALSMRDR